MDSEIIDLYQNKKLSCGEIAKIKNFKNSANVYYILKKNGIKTRTKSESKKRLTLNEDYFSIIDTDEKAYFLGFIFSDGCITDKRLIISIAEEDSYLLDNFKQYLNYKGNLYKKDIKKINCKNQRSLEITSKKMIDYLKKYGLTPNKSLTIGFPSIKYEFIWSFIRGLFDGDGSVFLTKRKDGDREFFEPGVTIITNTILVEGLYNFLYNEGFDKIHKSIVNDGKNVNLIIKEKRLIKLFFDKIYNKENNSTFLKRKKEKFYEIFSYYETRKFIYKNEAIYQYDKDDNLIKEWSNLDEICLCYKNISRECILKCLRGVIKTSYKSIWKLK